MIKSKEKVVVKLNDIQEAITSYIQPEIQLVFAFGFINGLMLLLAGNTLNFWLAKEGFDVKSLGLMSLVAIPYNLKYLYSPIIDRYRIPFLSKYFLQRKSWSVLCLFFLTIFIFLLGNTNPQDNIWTFLAICVVVSFFAATLDVVLNAYRIEIIKEEQKPTSSSSYTIGYRLGMLISGAGAIYLSSSLDWGEVYKLISLFTLIILALTLLIKEKEYEAADYKIKSLSNSNNIRNNFVYRNFIEPFKHIGNMKNFSIIIIFITLYRLSDYMISPMLNIFLLQTGFSDIEIATAGKFFGAILSIIGGLIASYLMINLPIKKALLYFGIAHSISHISYFLIIHNGNDVNYLYLATALEALTGGAAMIAYFTYISSLCKGPYIGTQYGLLFSLIGISRTILPSFSGYLVSYTNWNIFFIFSILLCIPGIIVLKYLK